MYNTLKYGHLSNNIPISWYIINQTKESMLLLSKNGIDSIAFINPDSKTKPDRLKGFHYDNSDLKLWLNGYFLQECFTENEQTQVCSISIPSANDIEQWFPTESERICFPSQQALDHGASVYEHISDINKSCTYWLSDTGRKAGYSAAIVMANGKIYKSAYMSAHNVCVRPLIMIKIKELAL